MDQNQDLQFHCNEASQNIQGKNPHVTRPSSYDTCFMSQKEEEQKLLSAISLWGRRKSHPVDKNRVPPYSQLGLDILPANGAGGRFI